MIGRTISHYRIQGKLGEGGMGVVYKAEDTKLERAVALKFLAPHLLADHILRKRFEREAKAVAALDHPNICTAFEIDEAEGSLFLAMAFVEGRTVKDMIAERPLKLEDALDIATQTAEGLRAAHEKGIVHRDIKPANVMLNPRGQVKIMDFGLAQLTDATLTQGSVAGTPAYMSPEQVQGQPVDRRSDLWSLGVMLYEMITGRRPFAGDRPETVFFAIRERQPEPVTALRAGLPMELEWIIGKCLSKDPATRYQHADDLIVDLATLRKKLQSNTATAPGTLSAAPPPRKPVQTWITAAVIVFALAAVTVAALRFLRPSPGPSLSTVKFTFTPPTLARGADTEIDAEVSISPNGRHITYVDSSGGQLFIRDIDQEQARPVPGATRVYQVFWSPDSRFIGYAAGLDLVKIPVQGGTPSPIAKLSGQFKRATWSSDGETIVFCDLTGMYSVPAKGGEPTRIVEHPHIEHPSLLDLPGGRRAVLYQAVDAAHPGHAIYVQVLGEKRLFVALSKSSNPYPAYSPTGQIIYADNSGDSVAIFALPFSLASLKVTGKAFPIAQRASSPQVSRNGTLVFSDVPTFRLQLAWCDRSGKKLADVGEPQIPGSHALSPDGRLLAIQSRGADTDIWIHDLDRGSRTRITFDQTNKWIGAWSPSGDEVTYSSYRGSNSDIFSKPAGGAGEEKLLVGTPMQERVPNWSPDGKYLIYEVESPDTKTDLVYRERRPDGRFGEPVAFARTPVVEARPRFSPEGRFVAYYSLESGRPEVYVRPFPNGAQRWQVSTRGGIYPKWNRKGAELFYVEPPNKLMSVSISTSAEFSAGVPTMLFEKPTLLRSPYDVAPDGKRFLVHERLPNQPPLAVHVVHNWFEEFRGKE